MAYQAVRSRVQGEAHSWLTQYDGHTHLVAEDMITHASPRELLNHARLDHVRLVERVNVAHNSITFASMEALASVLRLSPTLQSRALLGGLTHLDLSNNPGIGDRGLEILAEGLLRNQSLRVLLLREIRMHFNGLYAICGFLTETWTLEQLDIRGNTVQVDGIMALAKTLNLNYSLKSLFMDRKSSTLVHKDHNSNIQTVSPNSPSKEELETVFLDEIDAILLRNRLIPESERGKPKGQTSEGPKDDSNLDEDIEKAEQLLERSTDVSTVGEDEEQAARDLADLLAAELPEAQTSLHHADSDADNDVDESMVKNSNVAFEATEALEPIHSESTELN
ncbi:hypothetical protein Ciccas_010341 [Cichlidogyrus casuarinus]|uniref:Uncharacterized protein n=1 Tax=Cichlidogyrus casuarinus TaxID=1844966 RepID=A0ABD2PUF6_9PLAT